MRSPSTFSFLALALLVWVEALALTQSTSQSRRTFLGQQSALVATAVVAAESQFVRLAVASDEMTVFKTNSGLRYIELSEGTGPSPRYGQLCSIKYSAYLKLPNSSAKQGFDSDSYLVKHGNRRIIEGLDEGLHTMKVGGKRRIIIPPKLGFVDSGLGPLPQSPFDRFRLNGLLDKMIEKRGGDLIYDVELVSVIDDEADQGYYEDSSLTEEQFNTLRDNIQNRAIQNRASEKLQQGEA